MPSYDEHVEFWKAEPYKLAMIVHYVDEDGCEHAPVGYCYITKQNELGIFVSELYRGRGIATESLGELFEIMDGDIFANVAPSNYHSRHLFEKLGFDLIQLTYRKEQPALLAGAEAPASASSQG